MCSSRRIDKAPSLGYGSAKVSERKSKRLSRPASDVVEMHLSAWRDLSYYLSRALRWGVFLGLIYVGWKVIPAYAAALQFERSLADYTRSGATAGLSGDEIHSNILWRARQMKLPVGPQHIWVETGERVAMARVTYQVPIELGPWDVVLNFNPASREHALITKKDIEQLKKALE